MPRNLLALSLLTSVLLTCAAMVWAARPSSAGEVPWKLAAYIDRELLTWVNDVQIVDAIRAQNLSNRGLTPPEIIARNKDWLAQRDTARRPLVEAVLAAPVSDFLRTQVARSGGRITEIFLMDSHGLTVAASTPPSDYWQGDEAKFTNSFAAGAGAIYIGEVSFDDSTQTYQGQVSIAVTDPSGAVTGAITVGLEAAAFF